MSPSLTFTLDLEDHRPDETLPKRYPEITEKILVFLEERHIKATIFTVGTLAEKDPDLVKKIHRAGHEIAHHSYDHTTLDRQTPETFREETKRTKHTLEDLIGEQIHGYRAPVFSLTRKTLWAVDILKELGFSYSSSVLPVANLLHGLSGAPSSPFRWSNGLLEIPAPLARIGALSMPYLGGFYLRYLPFSFVQNQIRKAPENDTLWIYCHPYDFDPTEKNWKIKGASIPVSLLLWMNRRNTFKKISKLADKFNFYPPFKDQIIYNDLEIIDPLTL